MRRPALSFFLLCLVIVAPRPRGQEAAAADDPWTPLNLIDVATAQGLLRFDPELEPHIGEMRERIVRETAAWRAGRNEFEGFAASSDDIIKRVNELLGYEPDEPSRQRQRGVLGQTLQAMQLRLADPDKLEIIVILRETLREYLAAGGELPKFSYDSETDTGKFDFAIQFNYRMNAGNEEGAEADEAPRIKMTHLDSYPIIFRSYEDFTEKESLFEVLGEFDLKSVAVHELAETTIHQIVDYAGQGARWFDDGIANVITEIVLEDLGETEARELLLQSLTTSRYPVPREEILLQYWPSGTLSLTPDAVTVSPIKYELDLALARYAWSYHEARRLVDLYGVECIRDIMAEAAHYENLKVQQMIGVVTTATGEPMLERLRAYQPFRTFNQVGEYYVKKIEAAQKQESLEDEFIALSRVIELTARENYRIDFFCQAANLLGQLGHVEDGAGLLKRQIENLVDMRPDAALMIHEYMLFYAIQMDDPRLAYGSIEPILAELDDHVPARLVKAHRLLSAGDVEGSRTLAREALNDMGTNFAAETKAFAEGLAED